MAETAATVFLERVTRYGDRPALRTLAAGGAARDETLSWHAWGEAARRFAAALIADGHRPGEAVAILAGNRVCWPIADLGVLLAGGVSAGIYPTSAAVQVQRVLADSSAATVIVDTPAQLEKVRAVRAELPGLRTIVAVEPFGRAVTGWDHWLAAGEAALGDGVDAEVARRTEAAAPDDVALLIYTSGSTGEPRGAEIPHRYLLDSALSIRQTLGLHEDDTALSFLPFCHAAERVFGLYTRIVCGMEAALVEDHGRVWDAARAYGPTTFGGLPRFYEKAAESLQAEHEAAGGELRARWDRTLALGAERSRLRRAGEPVPPALEAEWRQLGAPVLARARALFGGRVRLATSGGASLPQHVSEYLDALGAHGARRVRADRAPVRRLQPAGPLRLRLRRPADARHGAAHRRGRRDPGAPRPADLRRIPRNRPDETRGGLHRGRRVAAHRRPGRAGRRRDACG
jgi:long-chain acyl-CoA synthetase